MVDKTVVEAVELVQKAREVPKKVIEEMPRSYQYQYARVRDDISVGDEGENSDREGLRSQGD